MMKIAEAKLEISYIDGVLELLESRISDSKQSGTPLGPILKEISSLATRRRALKDATDWTCHTALISDMPLSCYVNRFEQIEKQISMLRGAKNPDLHDNIKELLEAEKDMRRLLEAAYWNFDLEFPSSQQESDSKEE